VNRRSLRRVVSNAMVGLMILAVVVALLPLFFILFDLVVQGAGSLSFAFFTKMPAPAGETGRRGGTRDRGHAPDRGRRVPDRPAARHRGRHLLRRVPGQPTHLDHPLRADVLNGTPSIVVGVFAWTWIVATQKHFSALAGSAALAMLMIPMVLRTDRRDDQAGAPIRCARRRWRWVFRAGAPVLSIVLRPRSPGIVTGSLLASPDRGRDRAAPLHRVGKPVHELRL
jgi:phosphate transport system permease protein